MNGSDSHLRLRAAGLTVLFAALLPSFALCAPADDAHPQGQPSAPSKAILAVAFENVSEDRTLYWIGEAIADGLAREIRLAGGEAVDRQEREAVRDEMGVPTLSTLTLAGQIRVADELGAGTLVTGTYASNGSQLSVRARVVGISAGRVGPWLTATGSARSVVALQKDLFALLRRSLPLPKRPPTTAIGSPEAEDGVPEAAYEYLLKSFIEDDTEKRTKFLKRSLELAPAYLRARMELAEIYREAGQLQKAADALSSLATRDASLAADGETLLAEIQLELGQASDAEVSIRHSLSLKDTARAHLLLAKLAASRGDRTLAASEAQRSRALDPTDPELLDIEESIEHLK